MLNKKIRLSKEQWKKFFKFAFDIKNIEFNDDIVTGIGGLMLYEARISEERIYVQFNLSHNIFSSAYFNIDTFEYDEEFTDRQNSIAMQELHEEWKNNLN